MGAESLMKAKDKQKGRQQSLAALIVNTKVNNKSPAPVLSVCGMSSLGLAPDRPYSKSLALSVPQFNKLSHGDIENIKLS